MKPGIGKLEVHAAGAFSSGTFGKWPFYVWRTRPARGKFGKRNPPQLIRLYSPLVLTTRAMVMKSLSPIFRSALLPGKHHGLSNPFRSVIANRIT